MRARYVPAFLAAASLAVFLDLTLTTLDRYPPVIQDEPWIAGPAIKFAVHGVYGSDLFAGYYGAAQAYFISMPAYPLLLAASFKLLGIGLVQARLVSVLFGGLTLLATYLVGRRLVGTVPAAGAATLLVFWRVTRWGYVYGSGVPLLDLSRVARYDIAVAPLVLLATGVVVAGIERRSSWLFVAGGALVGLATLCQPYGAFWLLAVAPLFFWREGWTGLRGRSPYLFLTGFVLAIIPWLVFIAVHPADYFGQMRFLHSHLLFFDPAFYLHNLESEYRLYPLGLFSGGPRAGSLLLLVGLPVALVAMIRDAWGTRNIALAAVAFGWLVPQVLFALADSEKMFGHVVALFPFAALVLCWGGRRLWQATIEPPSLRRILRIALVAGVAAIVAEGTGGIIHLRAVAASTTPYTRFESRIDRMLARRTLVLGSPEFQLGLLAHPYRSFAVPFLLADGDTYSPRLSFEVALKRVNPAAILMERPFVAYLRQASHPNSSGHEVYMSLERYLRRHHARLLGIVRDRSYFYAPVRVYAVDRTG